MTKYDFKKVATKSEIPPGRGKTVLVHGKPMALVNIDATFYAINSIGPHRGGPLANGQLINRFGVECPGHKWTFDLRTGKPDHEGGHEVATYEVKVEGDDIFIGWIKKT